MSSTTAHKSDSFAYIRSGSDYKSSGSALRIFPKLRKFCVGKKEVVFEQVVSFSWREKTCFLYEKKSS